jgi:hypothetical protein
MVGGRIIARSLDVEGHPIVGEHEFSLAAGEETDFTFGYNIDIGEPRADRTHAYELRIPAPDPTRTEPEAPVDFVTRVAAFNDVMRIGIAPKLSKWEEIEGTQTAMVEAAAIGPLDDGATYSIGIDDAEGGSVRSQIFRLNENDGRATIALDATSRAKAEGGTLWLARMGADPAQPPERISSVAIAELPRPKARLRIAPESVRIAPESVSDGRTLFVQFDVENAGDAAAQRYTAALYDGDPATGGRVLYSHFGNRRIAGRALRPGERERIQLRWDTFESAGERDVWLAIDAGRLKGASTPEDLKLHRPIRVRTKADLKYAETRTQISRLAGERFRYAFTTQVQNAGETDAEFVTVQIYRRNESPPAEPANRLALTQGEMLVESLVERVPANGSVEVQLVWEPDPERYSAELLELIGDKFLAVYQLKGSQQRAAALYRGSRDR